MAEQAGNLGLSGEEGRRRDRTSEVGVGASSLHGRVLMDRKQRDRPVSFDFQYAIFFGVGVSREKKKSVRNL